MARDIPKPEDIDAFLQRVRPHESKLTVRMPAELHHRLKRLAENVTGQRRGGLQDLVIILLRHGLDAIEQGELEIMQDARTTAYGIRRRDE